MRRKIQVVIAFLIIINGFITLAYVFVLRNMHIAFILASITGILGCLLHWFEEISTIYINNRKKGVTGAIRTYLNLINKGLIIRLKNKTVRAFLLIYAVILTILVITLKFNTLYGISMLCVFSLYIISLRVIWGYSKTELGLLNCIAMSVLLTCFFIQVEVIILLLNI